MFLYIVIFVVLLCLFLDLQDKNKIETLKVALHDCQDYYNKWLGCLSTKGGTVRSCKVWNDKWKDCITENEDFHPYVPYYTDQNSQQDDSQPDNNQQDNSQQDNSQPDNNSALQQAIENSNRALEERRRMLRLTRPAHCGPDRYDIQGPSGECVCFTKERFMRENRNSCSSMKCDYSHFSQNRNCVRRDYCPEGCFIKN